MLELSDLAWPLSREPRDHYEYYEHMYLSRAKRVTLQWPSPGFERLDTTYWKTQGKLKYVVNSVPNEYGKQVWKLLTPKERAYHSRFMAIAWPKLVINEMDRRIEQAASLKKQIEKYRVTPRQSHELRDILLETTEQYMTIDWKWIEHYAKEHWRSSVKPGYPWSRFYRDLMRGKYDIHQIFDQLKLNLSNARMFPDLNYADVKQYVAGRARADPVRDLHHNWAIKNRDRGIQYGPARSLYTLFIPRKVDWMIDIYSKVEDILDLGMEIYLPHLVGGGVYGVAHENRDTPYTACDATTWDGIVLQILGESFNIFAAILRGYPNLTSGQSWTSIIGTIGSLVLAQYIKGDEANILGDDIAVWNMRGNPPDGVVSIDQTGTELRYNLGLAFHKDPPAIIGVRMSTDNPKKMISKPIYSWPYTPELPTRPVDASSKRWRALYDGMVEDEELIELIIGVGPELYTHPGEVMEGFVEQGEAFLVSVQ